MPIVLEYAPEGMPAEMVEQRPDVVFMAFGARPHPVREFSDWDAAVNYTRELANPATPSGELARPGFQVTPSKRQALTVFREGRVEPLRDYQPSLGPLGLLASEEGWLGLPEGAGRFLEQAKEIRPGSFLARSVAPGERGPGPLLDPSRHIPEKLTEAESQYAEEQALRSVETGSRSQAERDVYEELIAQGHSPAEADRIASRELAGAYPKLRYKGFDDFSPEAIDDMVKEVRAHFTGNRNLTGKRAVRAITDAVEKGKVPTASQIRDLREVFGDDTVEDIVAAAKDDKHWLMNVLGIPRTLRTTLDVSYLLRPGLVAGARHPLMAGRNFRMS